MTRLSASRRVSRFVVAVILLTAMALPICGVLWVGNEVHKGARQWSMATELGSAIVGSDYAKVEALLRAGADPDAADMDHSLLLALPDERMVALLRQYGAHPSHALRAAHDVETARVLLEMGADPNAGARGSGETPLMEQASRGNIDIVQFLLEHGGDPTVKDSAGRSVHNWIEMGAAHVIVQEGAKYAQESMLISHALAIRISSPGPAQQPLRHPPAE
jgi:uncharacterized protein